VQVKKLFSTKWSVDTVWHKDAILFKICKFVLKVLIKNYGLDSFAQNYRIGWSSGVQKIYFQIKMIHKREFFGDSQSLYFSESQWLYETRCVPILLLHRNDPPDGQFSG